MNPNEVLRVPKRRGYCFDCHTEFWFIRVSRPFPNCGSERWVRDPQDALAEEEAI